MAAYLTGSLLGEADPLLGGTTDIDLVLVHDGQPGLTRQIVKLTPDFHLDIRHRAKSDFKSPRELRTDPLLGWEMYDPMLLYEREKFFQFVQAGLRAGSEFHAPRIHAGPLPQTQAGAREAGSSSQTSARKRPARAKSCDSWMQSAMRQMPSPS